MVSSLAAWAPATSLACPLLRKATAGASKLQWTDALEKEYQNVRRLMKNNLKLSPYDPTRFLNRVINGSAIHSAVYVPKGGRTSILKTLHLCHSAPGSMIANTKGRIYWLNISRSMRSTIAV